MRITLTIQELTAKLGYMKYAGAFMGKDNQPILSFIRNEPFILPRAEFTVGSKWEMDECECGHAKTDHPFIGIFKEKRIDDCQIGMCQCQLFKPLLATVKAIRLTERCECGHKKHTRYCSELYNSKDGSYDPMQMCGCKQFKPARFSQGEKGHPSRSGDLAVQTVEITVSE